ncbi:hypothetical protein EVAR_74852_1 [Eumeta japonica]|uniref:Uncharacterized protein n=1 Tax=Eumeta variegata TaxID=151549 RepID=A0A4C1SPG4_EUMVA|nr:hypothetical protein EVAR_74852_1 [Eumeta japonica]
MKEILQNFGLGTTLQTGNDVRLPTQTGSTSAVTIHMIHRKYFCDLKRFTVGRYKRTSGFAARGTVRA